MSEAFFLGSREALLLLAGAAVLLGFAFVAGRVLRSRRHGFSIRLQLFLTIFASATISAAVIGVWAVERLHDRAQELMAEDGSSTAVLYELLSDFGPKMAFLVILLGAAAAAAAFALGRGLAGPLERLAKVAEAVARGERTRALPVASGREVRRLTAALDQMRRSLEDRHHIEQFVADLSHELKNPVSAVRAATEVLQEGAAEDPVARARFLGRIDEAARRLEVLLHDLLALARLEAHGVDAERGVVQLADEVAAAIRSAGPKLEAGRLRIEVNLTPIRAPGDARWLRRAVDNLLANAIRYSPPGGLITVTLRPRGDEAVLTVQDEGSGVPEAMRARIFARFVSDRAHADGTGLGLAIVRSIAEQHGGTAQLLESDRGARFEMTVRAG